MSYFADTSLLCALYREQDNSPQADLFMASRADAEIAVSSLVLWEFRQSVRFQVFRHHHDRSKGFSKQEADRMLVVLAANLKSKVLTLRTVDWPDVHSLAEKLSAKYTMTGGHRPMDILHLAAARHLQSSRFLTFDGNQKKLAEAEGLMVPL